MILTHSSLTNIRARRVLVRLLQTVALTLVVALALQARAAGSREIQSRVAPVYPELARRMKISGAVKVEATVAPDGKVLSAKGVSGSQILTPAAEEAVRHWKFEPGTSESTVEVQVNFAIGG